MTRFKNNREYAVLQARIEGLRQVVAEAEQQFKVPGATEELNRILRLEPHFFAYQEHFLAYQEPRAECDQIWAFRLANCGAKPREKSDDAEEAKFCLLYTSPSPRDATLSRMPSSA